MKRFVVLLMAALLIAPVAARERKDELAALLAQGAVVYYGQEPVDKSKFTRAKVVILEPAHWTTRSIRRLREQGKIVLGYLSVGEIINNARTRKNYQTLSLNQAWDSMRVDPSDPDWIKTMLRRTRLAKERQLDGMMLDTVDITVLHPEAADSMAELIEAIHGEMPDGFLMTNRGFSVLDKVADVVDGVVFENANNRGFNDNDRAWVEAQCQLLSRLAMPVLVLDYAEQCDPEESRKMAERFEWSCFVAPSTTLAKPLSDEP